MKTGGWENSLEKKEVAPTLISFMVPGDFPRPVQSD